MIQLEDNSLSFTFPEIPRQLEALVEQHIQKISPRFVLPESRYELVQMLDQFIQHGTMWNLSRETSTSKVMATAEALTAADIEAALQATVKTYVQISDAMSTLKVSFQRTLRIPDDGGEYPLPEGLGEFPVRPVDDFDVPAEWLKRGGVMMPMYQSEALWMRFSSSYPFALRVGAGKFNAVSGEPWAIEFRNDPQNYVVVPNQRWLDGFAVGEGLIRQFVAMPLGSGFSVEEQLIGKAESGGIQLQACPMRVESYFNKNIVPNLPEELLELIPSLFRTHLVQRSSGIKASPPPRFGSMGLAAGGLMRQEIYEDPYPFEDWDTSHPIRCFVQLCNAMAWKEMTHEDPPHPPFTAKEYEACGIPWFDYYRDDLKALQGSDQLAGVESIARLEKGLKGKPITPKKIIQYGNTRRPPRRVIREMPGFQFPPDPVKFLKVPIVQFSEKERTALIKKMKRSREAIADSYKPSLDALLACLHSHADWDMSGSTQNADGSTKDLILVFMSPPNTWHYRAGRGGFYTVDPETLMATKFTMTVMN